VIIHHYYPHKTNIGDLFVVDGIRKLIRERLPGSEFVDIPVNESPKAKCFGLLGGNLDYSNSEADLIVIGGSNLYECRRNGAWGVTTDLDSIKKIQKPVMLIGLGSGSSFRRKVRGSSAQSREEICFLNKIAIGSSVRDLKSGDFLRSLGIREYTVTGCPSTFLFDNPFAFKNTDIVAISVPPARFKKYRFMFFRLISAIRKYIDYCRQIGLRPVLSCHDARDIEFAKGLQKDGVHLFYSEKTNDYYELYGMAKLVIGFRLHATIVSLSLGVPFIPVYFDIRGMSFSETYDSLKWSIDGTKFQLCRRLIRSTKDILDRKQFPFVNFLNKKQMYKDVMRSFINICVKKL
jgi:polysaccharide pyruvyl transferase WcaK-like protein